MIYTCKCGGELRVTNTYKGTAASSTRRRVCLECRRIYIEIAVLKDYEDLGIGAKGIASRMQRGEKWLKPSKS